jgi:hypothetical protein
MEAWQDAPLTEGQRPVLLSGELECLLVPSVSIRTLYATSPFYFIIRLIYCE